MNFELEYTPEQETFRAEVRSWLKANCKPGMRPVDQGKLSREQYDYGREMQRRLASKGWLAPLYPKEYGGGGLTQDQAIIVAEELEEAEIPHIGNLGLSLGAPAIMVWGTDEQKKRFLPPILTGEVQTWQCFTEPDAGTDLASLQLRADKEGDTFVLNGTKIFVGSPYDVDYLYTLAVTDQTKPRHSNIGAFLVPANTPGITIRPLHIIASEVKNTIFYDNVRVPRTYLIGGETDGWRVAQSTLEVEHGGSGSVSKRDKFFEKLVQYAKETKRDGVPLSKDPDVRAALVDVYVTSRIRKLFELRNYWMRTSKVQWAWEGSQNSLFGKQNSPKSAKRVLDAFGPYCLLTDSKHQPLGGEFENQQRASLLTHPGGTPEAQKIIMARRIGIARTRQTAAAIH